MDNKTVSSLAAIFLFAATINLVWAQEADPTRSVEHESLRNRICPSSATPGMSIKEIFDTKRQRTASGQVFDNLSMLGMKTVTAWALVTTEGIILFDAMSHYNVEETVIESLKAVDLDPADVKYVIVSHGHDDYFGGASYSQENFGTRIVLTPDSVQNSGTDEKVNHAT